MVRQVTPLEGFEVTLRKFERSKKGVNDYIELFLVYHRLITFLGHGEGYENIEVIVEKVLSERDMQVEDKMDIKSDNVKQVVSLLENYCKLERQREEISKKIQDEENIIGAQFRFMLKEMSIPELCELFDTMPDSVLKFSLFIHIKREVLANKTLLLFSKKR